MATEMFKVLTLTTSFQSVGPHTHARNIHIAVKPDNTTGMIIQDVDDTDTYIVPPGGTELAGESECGVDMTKIYVKGTAGDIVYVKWEG